MVGADGPYIYEMADSREFECCAGIPLKGVMCDEGIKYFVDSGIEISAYQGLFGAGGW